MLLTCFSIKKGHVNSNLLVFFFYLKCFIEFFEEFIYLREKIFVFVKINYEKIYLQNKNM